MGGQGTAMRRCTVTAAVGALALAGVIAASSAPAAADTGADTGKVSGTPCTITARACVDLDKQNAWLITAGKVTSGPVRISSGGLGKETPLGTFHVYAKDQDHKSQDFPLPNGQPAPMPWSVFFEPKGIAFHGGNPKRASAGCIHVPLAEAIVFFNTLNVGDEVQVTQTTTHVKGGFYGVNHLHPPTLNPDGTVKAPAVKPATDKTGSDNDSHDKTASDDKKPSSDSDKDSDKTDSDKNDSDKSDSAKKSSSGKPKTSSSKKTKDS